jgi:hypothetical protein
MRSCGLFLLTAAVTAALCPAQVKLYVVLDAATGSEREVTGSVFDIGTAGSGDTLQTRFRMRNTGTTTQQVQSIRVAGQGFTLSTPSLPYTLAPNGLPLDFTVRFTAIGGGSYSANLTAGTISVLLRATVVAAPVLVTESVSGIRSDIAAGSTVALGNVQRGQKLTRTFWLENRNGSRITVRSITFTGIASGLFVYRGPSLPVDILDGGSQQFDIEFTPTASQQYTATLSIDGRAFGLTASGVDPPLPAPSIVVEPSPLGERQYKLTMRLAAPAPSAVSGGVQMEFRPATSVVGVEDDPGVRFLSSGGRSLSVVTRRDDDAIWLTNNVKDPVFQSGTTAGEILFTLAIGGHKITYTMPIAPAAVTIDTALAGRRTQDLDVTITGFDNTRTISQAAFTFFDTSGRPIGPGAILADVRREFERFFAASSRENGGIFTMRASFPVQGPVSQIAGVEVELTNSSGSSRTQRLMFP